MKTIHDENKKWFEENFLDGDKIQDGQMLSSEFCFDAIMEMREKTIDECMKDTHKEIQKYITDFANQDTERGSQPEWKVGYWSGLNTVYNFCEKKIKTITNLNNLKNL